MVQWRCLHEREPLGTCTMRTLGINIGHETMEIDEFRSSAHIASRLKRDTRVCDIKFQVFYDRVHPTRPLGSPGG